MKTTDSIQVNKRTPKSCFLSPIRNGLDYSFHLSQNSDEKLFRVNNTHLSKKTGKCQLRTN